MNEKSNTIIKRTLGIIIMIIILSPMWGSIIWSTPCADDFSEVITINNEKSFFLNAIERANYMFKNWGGQWPVQFLEIFISPIARFGFGNHATGLTLVVTFGIFIATFYLFISTTLHEILGIERKKLCFLLVILILLVLFNRRIYNEIFYWFTGNCYLWELEFILLTCIIAVKYIKTPNILQGIIYSLVGFIAGFGYIYDVSMGCYILLAIYKRNKYEQKPSGISVIRQFSPFLFAVLGGLLSCLAPGNFVRHQYFDSEGLNIKKAISDTIHLMLSQYKQLFCYPLFGIMILLCIVLGYKNYRIKRANSLLAYFLPFIGWGVSSIGTLFPVALGYNGLDFPNRMMFVFEFQSIVWGGLCAVYLGGCIYNRRQIEKRMGMFIAGLSVTVLLIPYITGLCQVEQLPYIKIISNYSSIIQESEYNLNMLRYISTSKEDCVIIPKELFGENEPSGIINPLGLMDDSQYWVNVALSRYFKKNEIILK